MSLLEYYRSKVLSDNSCTFISQHISKVLIFNRKSINIECKVSNILMVHLPIREMKHFHHRLVRMRVMRMLVMRMRVWMWKCMRMRMRMRRWVWMRMRMMQRRMMMMVMAMWQHAMCHSCRIRSRPQRHATARISSVGVASAWVAIRCIRIPHIGIHIGRGCARRWRRRQRQRLGMSIGRMLSPAATG